jgi:hypothetical protein
VYNKLREDVKLMSQYDRFTKSLLGSKEQTPTEESRKMYADFFDRFQAVKTTLQYAQFHVKSLSNSIAFMKGDANFQISHDSFPTMIIASPNATAVTPQAIAAPTNHVHWTEDALIVIRDINKITKGHGASSLFDMFDRLRNALDHLKPCGGAQFRFQRKSDHESDGLIYWNGSYRRWFYLLAPTKESVAAHTVPEKQYLSILNPSIRPDALKRKIWVAMDTSLRERVMNNDITLSDAEAQVR